MCILKRFYPDQMIYSAYDIDYQKYYDMGYRGIIYDIDNTLVPHGKPANAKAVRLFKKLRGIGFQTCFLSNNQVPRVEMFNEKIQSLYICDAHKPSRVNYEKAMKLMGTNRSNTLFVGDQIFTDIWGARKAGIHGILTKPLRPREEIQIVLKRVPEKIVLASYAVYLKKSRRK